MKASVTAVALASNDLDREELFARSYSVTMR
jgi:hypothetical protein